MNMPKSTLWAIAFFVTALIGTVVTIIQIQNQQDVRTRATGDTTVTWQTSQFAVTSCPTSGDSAVIIVSFSNLEQNRSDTAMNIKAVDQQTNKSTTISNIRGGETKTAVIETGRTTLSAGTVKFTLTWTDGHSGTDSRSANYKAVSNCNPPTTTPTQGPTVTPTNAPTGTPSPTPTVCPTLEPVKNVHIECPNCE